MKKLLTLISVIFISAIVLTTSAEVITKEIARQTADIFLSLDSEWHGATDAQVRMVEKDGIPAYYIVEYSEGGWAIVSAQSSSSPIIGYNTTGQYATPGAMRELLDFNARIITARAKDLGNIEHAGWQRARQRRATAESIITSTPDIAPLIKIDLDQSEPFNKYCPTIDGKNTLVGCVAVGMTQAIMVQGYPAKPIGSHTYICENTGIHSIDYDAEPAYDWNAINNSKETGNYDEVARLLYHAGVSVDMIYGLGASGSQTDYVAQALISNFGYDKRIVHTSARHPDSNKWLELIVNELAHGRAVVYGATSVEGGHCWNIDGWKQSTQMIHCNWGWSGYGNGYFSLDNLVDSYQDISFLYNHRAVFGIAAPSTAPYDILLHSTQYAIDTEAGTPLSYVEVLSADNTATYSYELFGPNGTQSPYQISNNKLTSTERVTDSDKFEYVRIKATNITTGISYEEVFNIQIVSANVHKLLGSYKAFANSPINNNSDEEWDITIYADKSDANKLWIQPVCTISGLMPTSVKATYATYNEATSTLTMPIGQMLYETPDYQLISGIASKDGSIETTGNITLQATNNDKGIVISFPENTVFGVGNAIGNEWWYQALMNITFTQKLNTTAPYGIELSNTIFSIGTAPNTHLADVVVLCDNENTTFNYEVYDREGNTSPYKVVNNTLVSSETIADSDAFKYLRMKVTNALTGEAYEQVFDIQVVEDKAAMFVGKYEAYANSAFKDKPDEEWVVNITADNSVPNKIWIQPICLFSNLDAKFVKPVYATYNVIDNTLTLPLGQVLYEQGNKYRMILGSSVDNSNINTTGSVEMQVLQSNEGITISFASDYIIGVGNAIGNEWWYQALHNIEYTQVANNSTAKPADINELAGDYNAFAHSAFKDYPDEEWQVKISIDPNTPNKLWIQPIFMFADLTPKYINSVYATYDAESGAISIPLGQVLYEQDDKYRIIIGASFDGGKSRDTSGNILFYATKEDENIVIKMDSNAVIGSGNAVTDQWWWQALYDMTYTKERTYEKINVDGIYYNITSGSKKTVQVTFKGKSHDEYSNEYTGEIIIPETITYDGTIYTVTSIEEYSFYFCTGITAVSIPATITEIGTQAFCYCVSITELDVKAEEPPVIYAETFLGVDRTIPLYVPDKSKEKYRIAEYWNEFTNLRVYSSIENSIVDDMEIAVHNGTITLTGIADDAVVNIYSLQGMLMHNTTAGNIGNITLPRGAYILQIEGNSCKIAI